MFKVGRTYCVKRDKQYKMRVLSFDDNKARAKIVSLGSSDYWYGCKVGEIHTWPTPSLPFDDIWEEDKESRFKQLIELYEKTKDR